MDGRGRGRDDGGGPFTRDQTAKVRLVLIGVFMSHLGSTANGGKAAWGSTTLGLDKTAKVRPAGTETDANWIRLEHASNWIQEPHKKNAINRCGL